MGQAALAWQRALRHLGFVGDVYAEEVAPGYRSLVRPASALRPAPDALVLYHHGIASSLAGTLLHLPCRRGVVFHNITPARFYAGTRLELALTAGRAQLAALAEGVELSIGVSGFNARELEVAGHRNVKVVPLYVEPERFAASEADEATRTRLQASAGPTVISVSRVVAHKRVEDLLALHAELRRLHPHARLLLVGGYDAGSDTFKALSAQARALGGVHFLGRVSHSQLVAAYRSADVYVSMSEHEGFGVPLVEAMAADLPVLAFGAAAVPETMGGRGIVFDEKHFAGLAELVSVLQEDAALRANLLAGQRARLADFSLPKTVEALGAALELPPRVTPGRRARPKVAVVVQRYGEEIRGGAEAHARMVATRLAEHAQVDVLTTCASDHLTWDNTWPEGVEHDGPVRVERFATTRGRQMQAFNRLSRSVFGVPQDLVGEARWVAEQGPLAPGLLAALSARRDDYDAFIFFTYLYAPTAWGVPLVADKALVVPTAHDEAPFRFHQYADVFVPPRALLCNTPEEEALIRQRFPQAARSLVVGVGVDAPKVSPARFRERFGLTGPYLFYVGRLEAGKGVPELLAHHQQLVAGFHDAPTLVLAGRGELTPRGQRVVCLGEIDDEAKWDGMAGALAVVVPSRYESLSLLALEAFAVGTPVLGNAGSEVVKGQLQRSGGGLTWSNADEFARALQEVGRERERFSKAARAFARKHRWPAVIATYLKEIDR
jgi:glycosyltransferase involved in cell wall biosynthesis